MFLINIQKCFYLDCKALHMFLFISSHTDMVDSSELEHEFGTTSMIFDLLQMNILTLFLNSI